LANTKLVGENDQVYHLSRQQKLTLFKL